MKLHPKIAVVILAAGKGTRMSHELPKALVPVAGMPMVLRVVKAAEAVAGRSKPVLVVGYRKELIKQAVGRRATYVWQRKQLGTGHAVRACERALRGKVDDILVVYADQPMVTSKTLRALVAARRKHRAVMSLVTVHVSDYRGPRKVFEKYGRIMRDKSGTMLQRCIEYKDATPAERRVREVNSGYYCFDAQWLWKTLPKLQKKNVSGEYYLTDLMGIAVAQGQRVVPLALADWREGLGANTVDDVAIAENVLSKKKRSM